MNKEKPPLSWTIDDYDNFGIEAPDAVKTGATEGEAMEREDIISWFQDTIRCLSVLKEEYPEKYKEQFRLFLLDLDYLKSLDKITEEEYEKLKDQENFNFGQ